jgi:hypothetical protein
VGHDVTLQTQAPFEQISPAPHAAPPPQVHAPDAEQPSAVVPQVLHVAPSVPQVEAVGGWQSVPVQQPVGHEAASQTHAPPTQACPTPHGGPDPHMQLPVLQPSAFVASHDAQVAPPVPHTASVVAGEVQVAPTQQPSGHDDALQTHTPPEHSWPAAQAAPLPHEQAPAVEQLSVWPGAHAIHAAPPAPHSESERALQVGPEQQVGHVAAHPLQAPWLQVWLAGQLWQAVPALPQAAALSPVWQLPDAQHPVGQAIPSQTHAPFRHRWPIAQAAPAPQLQTPAEEQLSDCSMLQGPHVSPGGAHAEREVGVHVSPSQHPPGHDVGSHTQAPEEQCCPGPQGAVLPQRHSPALQLSDVTALHVKHDAPGIAQFAADSGVHAVPLQHPLAHDVESHTQRPPAQRCPSEQAGLPPQVHLPAAEQASAELDEHAAQVAPAMPHVAKVEPLQVVPLQQPSAQAQLGQTPAAQGSPPGHWEHARPALPHALGVLPGWHNPPAQHPLGQEVASQVHAPARHRCPVAQAGAPPHRQSPPPEQESLVVPSQAPQTQAPPTHCWLGEQGGPLPHEGPVWV